MLRRLSLTVSGSWLFALLICVRVSIAETLSTVPTPLKLVYASNQSGGLETKSWVFSDPAAWKFVEEKDSRVLELVSQSKYKPAVRSPFNIALISNLSVGSFVIEAELLQTSREYGHRDLCLFFGFKSPTEFYYVHMATAADNNAHNVFIVNKKPRTNIATETTKGVDWGQDVWHKVKVERRIEDGSILVFFDDMQKPIMRAKDQTFVEGLIGFGSFDDTGRIRNIRLSSDKTSSLKVSFPTLP